MQAKIARICICLLTILFFILSVLIRALISIRRQNKKLKKENLKKTEDVKNMSEYAEKSQKISAAKSGLENRLRSADSDEDIKGVVDDIVAANNSRVRKPAKK